MSSAELIRRPAAAWALASVVLVVAGCGGSPATSLSDGRAARWHDTIARIRSAAAAADRPAALAALARLSGYLDRDEQAGQLAASDAAALRVGIAQARRRLPRPSTTPAAVPAASAATVAPAVAAIAHARPSRPRTPAPAAHVATGRDEAAAGKDAARARKDAARAQHRAAKPPKAKPAKVKAKGPKR